MQEYNFYEIGSRIAEERRARGWSQEEMIERIRLCREARAHREAAGRKRGTAVDGQTESYGMHRNTLSAIETGRKGCNISMELLLTICEVFGWDMGRLLGEYQYADTIDAMRISRLTGLSPDSVQVLMFMRKQVLQGRNTENDYALKTLDLILSAGMRNVQEQSDYPVWSLLTLISNYIYHENHHCDTPTQDKLPEEPAGERLIGEELPEEVWLEASEEPENTYDPYYQVQLLGSCRSAIYYNKDRLFMAALEKEIMQVLDNMRRYVHSTQYQ